MSQELSDLNPNEHIILSAHLEAKTEEGANTLQEILLAIKKNTEVAEPGCLVFRVHRFKQLFMVYEEYTGKEAVEFHFTSVPFKKLISEGKEILVKQPGLAYYKEVTA
ncbi:hypothetical protein FRB94_005927 [Tulasnella sp. JGI-2019a]|nr:hypothetical protein FRB93_005194 [Tulasnella sp. JGI-2019a]KAG8999794.1 hypothetical protein FRB94_005927 [Tulasnella sp. JGI-2019a]KAG9028307.1 hypothetical protein FRB95_006611 [Tulasnella sp. JGI-2019a]